MQPQQRSSNLLLNWIVFFVLSMALWMGWTALMQRWAPPPAKKETATPVWSHLDKVSPKIQQQAFGRLALGTAPVGLGLGDAIQAATGSAVADWSADHPGKPAPKPQPLVKEPPAPRHDGIEMGGDGYPMTVWFTTHGAAVQKLVLTGFQEADELGKPVPNQKLTLINNDPNHGSDLIYHYPQADSDAPVDTLGVKEWQAVSVKASDGKQGFVETAADGTKTIRFTTTIPDMPVRVTKTFTLRPGDYHLGLALGFERTDKGTQPIKVRYQIAGSHGLPIDGVWYTSTYRNAYIASVNNGRVTRNWQDSNSIAHMDGGDQVLAQGGTWIEYGAIVNQYFASALVVDNHQDKSVNAHDLIAWARPTPEPGMMSLGGKVYPEKEFLRDITVRMVSNPVTLTADAPVVHHYVLYNGPVKVRLLKDIEPNATATVDWYLNDLRLDTFTDVPSPGPIGWFSGAIGWASVLVYATNFMHGFLWFLHHIVPNYGICIILMTLLVRLVMYPLSRRQAIAAARFQAKQKELQPEIKKLEEKYRDDSQAFQRAKLELMMKRGAHPMAAMGSCWVLFLQMPIFMGLYYALQESVFFRLERFLWMPSLAAPDMLIPWSTHIPVISDWANLHASSFFSFLYLGPFLNILPIVAVIIMAIQQQMMAPPAVDEQTAMQQKMMKYMSIFIGFVFYKVASGLALYYIVSSLWGVLERKYLPKSALAPETVPVTGKKTISTPAAARKARAQRSSRDEDDGKLQKVKDLWQKVLKEAKKK